MEKPPERQFPLVRGEATDFALKENERPAVTSFKVADQ